MQLTHQHLAMMYQLLAMQQEEILRLQQMLQQAQEESRALRRNIQAQRAMMETNGQVEAYTASDERVE